MAFEPRVGVGEWARAPFGVTGHAVAEMGLQGGGHRTRENDAFDNTMSVLLHLRFAPRSAFCGELDGRGDEQGGGIAPERDLARMTPRQKNRMMF